MKKKLLAGCGLVLILIVGFLVYKNHKKSNRAKNNATQILTVTQGVIEETVEATGEVSPLNRVEIKPPIQGRMEKLLVDEGDTVSSGQILAWMSSSDRAAIIDAARAQGSAEAQHWEDSYKATPIIAPLSGGIILRNVVVGQTVDGSTVLYAMSDKLMVMAQVDEADIGRVRTHMPARITLDAYPDQPIDGSVFQILHEGKNVSNVITYGVKIAPKKVPPFFRSQMTANVSFIVQRKENALLLPTTAVNDGPSGGKQVLVPNPEGKPNSVEIKTGIESGEKVEIISGLAEGDKVVIARSKYSPQKGPQTSPLTMGAQRGAGGGGGGGGRRQ